MGIRHIVCATVLACTLLSAAQAQLTQFTYQGYLNDANAPVNGLMDFRVSLWDAALAGNQIGATLNVENINVTDGLFIFDLDFGVQAFDGNARWLQLEVRPNRILPFETLTPRQPVTPAPTAIHASTATVAQFAQNGSLWVLTGDDLAYEDGNIGIGLDNPDARLHVEGAPANGLALNISDQLYVNELSSFVGIGRDTKVTTAELFGLYAPTTGFSGMYIQTDSGGWPFYGYSSGAGGDAYHYYNGTTDNWHLTINSIRMTVEGATGHCGIGVTDPDTTLHLGGVAGVDGIRFPDGTLQTTAISGDYWAEAGGDDIYYNNMGRVGVGTNSPDSKLHAHTSTTSALRGSNTSGNYAYFGSNSVGGYAEHNNGNWVQLATQTYGVRATHDSTNNYGYIGSANYGVFGRHEASAHYGRIGSSTEGVYGASQNNGTAGYLGGFNGVYGENTTNGTNGVLGGELYGVFGAHSSGTSAGLANSIHGVVGVSNQANGAGGVFLNTGGGKAIIAAGTAEVQVLEITGGSDLAEPFEIRADQGKPLAGMVVCIDAHNPGELIVSHKAYDRTVAGVISGAGGVNPGMIMRQVGTVADGTYPVALTGRAKVLCEAGTDPIQPGDLLTTSNTPGHAMRVSDHTRATGATIGKAMSSLPTGERGLVLVLVNLH